MAVSIPLQTPTPNAGAHAQGMLFAAQMLEAGQKAAAVLDPTSPLGQAILKALKEIGSKVGTPPADTQVNSLRSQLMEAQRSAMQRAALMGMQQRQGAAPAAAASPATAAAPQQQQMPMAA